MNIDVIFVFRDVLFGGNVNHNSYKLVNGMKNPAHILLDFCST